ncbi:hypothetical protein [Phormidium sp. CCY1219]|uniref:hypothetical protein n=1 Tax=Phormidium sp. CCY1219 TaxID=2886104 RepID=UPI002D1EB60D|nr:hypothetical protein [Phormidium sp. CCY1219]MEB3829851.1 hypothetical protein [Phormidium sp. CCY1219]
MPDGVLLEQPLPPPEEDFFAPEFYRLANPDLRGLSEDELLSHFLERGVAEGRRFLPIFDPNFYRRANPELANLTPRELFDHFISVGLDQGRRFSPVFDIDFYRENLEDLNPELIDQLTPEVEPPVSDLIEFDPNRPLPPTLNENLFNLFLETQLNIDTDLDVESLPIEPGEIASVNYSPYFDPIFYLSSNPDLAELFGPTNRQKALEHFVLQGINENRRYSLIFDPTFYLENSPDLLAAGLSREEALLHFELIGVFEGRRPSLNFDPEFYLNENPDLRARGLTEQPELIEQYLQEGLQEGRRSSLYFDPVAIDALVIPAETAEDAQETNGEDTPSAAQTLQEETFVKWNTPVGGVLTYSFVDTASAFLYPGQESGVGEVNEAIKNNVRQIMEEYDKVLPFSLLEVPDRPPNTGEIRILFANDPQYAYSYAPGIGTGGDIVLSRNFETDPQLSFAQGAGNFGYQRLVHEIGHALGLRQPNVYAVPPEFGVVPLPGRPNIAIAERPTFPIEGTPLQFSEDNNSNTAMSFNIAGVGASTPMPYDMRALQFLYGFSEGNDGNSFYDFDGTNFVGLKQTIWDAGGIDTLDFSDLPPIDTYFFDLNEGGQNTNKSVLDAATYQAINDPSNAVYTASSYGTYIGFGTTIENLIGTPVNDDILGNPAGNGIVGGAGADTIVGAEGPDTLAGGPGRDTFGYAPGDGTDLINDFNPAEDVIGLAAPLEFESLAVQQAGGDTLVRIASTGEILAVLAGVNADVLTPNNFVPFG